MTNDNTDTSQTPADPPEGTFWMFDREISAEELAAAYADALAEVKHRAAGTT